MRRATYPTLTLLTAGALLSCSNASSIPDFGAPDLDQIIVFYPLGGQVQGRGLEGAAPDGASHIFIKAHPNGNETVRPVDSRGRFTFFMLALGGNVLEISGASDATASSRGEPVFVRVPTGTFQDVDYVCCFEGNATEGTCHTLSERSFQENRPDGLFECPSPQTGRTRCTLDIQCGFEEGEWLRIDRDRITITPPDELGFIRVSGFVQERSLVTLQNRGLSGVGRPRQQNVQAQVSGDQGDFEFPPIPARGDDEIVLQVQDLNGFRSPALSMLVEDAPLAGFDVTGAFAWRPLRDGAAGTIAVQIAPFGVDRRGICPNHEADPQTCFTGGLTHEMVRLENLRIEQQGVDDGVQWLPTPLTPTQPDNIGYDGDVRAGPLDVVLVIDASQTAEDKGLLRTAAAEDAIIGFVSGMRQRDRVGVVAVGADIERVAVAIDGLGRPTSSGLFDGGGRSDLISSLRTTMQRNGSGSSRLFDGVIEAAKMLDEGNSSAGTAQTAGRIVVITTDEHAGGIEDSATAYFEALGQVEKSAEITEEPTRVDVVGISLTRTEKFDDVQDITAFTGGEYFEIADVQRGDVNQLELALTEIRSTLSGSFLLLYDVAIPNGVGKAARIEFDAWMNGVPQAVQYSGLLRVDLAAN